LRQNLAVDELEVPQLEQLTVTGVASMLAPHERQKRAVKAFFD
jgi:hypothetical protein